MNSGIYSILCTENGKRYIGQSMNIKKRIWTHFNYLKKGVHSNQYLQRAFYKYGKDSFEWAILGLYPAALLDHFEITWIQYFNSVRPNGFNLMGGGGALHSHSEETIQKLREASTGKKASPESCRKMAESQRGRKHTKESKKRISKAIKEKWTPKAREEMSKKMTGKKKSDKHRERMSKARKGQPWTQARWDAYERGKK